MKTSFEQNQHSIRDLFIETALLIKTNPGDAHLWNNMRDIFSIGQQMDLSSLVRHQLFPAEAKVWNADKFLSHCYKQVKYIFSNENTSHVNAFFNQKKRRLTPQKPIGLHPLLIMRLGEKARTISPTPMNTQGCTTFFPKNQFIKTNQNALLSQLYREPVRQPQFRGLEKIEPVNSPDPSDYRAMVYSEA